MEQDVKSCKHDLSSGISNGLILDYRSMRHQFPVKDAHFAISFQISFQKEYLSVHLKWHLETRPLVAIFFRSKTEACVYCQLRLPKVRWWLEAFPVPQLPLFPAQQQYEGQRHLRGLRHWKATSTLQSHVVPSVQLGLPQVSAAAVAPSPTVVVEPFGQGALPDQNCCWNIKSNPSVNYISWPTWPLTTDHLFGAIPIIRMLVKE